MVSKVILSLLLLAAAVCGFVHDHHDDHATEHQDHDHEGHGHHNATAHPNCHDALHGEIIYLFFMVR
jgi:hypothetical protein